MLEYEAKNRICLKEPIYKLQKDKVKMNKKFEAV